MSFAVQNDMIPTLGHPGHLSEERVLTNEPREHARSAGVLTVKFISLTGTSRCSNPTVTMY